MQFFLIHRADVEAVEALFAFIEDHAAAGDAIDIRDRALDLFDLDPVPHILDLEVFAAEVEFLAVIGISSEIAGSVDLLGVAAV